MTRNHSLLFAFSIGSKIKRVDTCFKIIGGHTDSPHIRLAPNAHFTSFEVEEFNIQTYGGGQWQTWFDRDLSLAGKVIIKDENNKLNAKLLRIDYPIIRIPNLPIHLTTEKNSFQWNDEKHLKSFIATTFFDDMNKEENRNINESLTPMDKVIIFNYTNQHYNYKL